jgi:antibiotic biosynthesis monooxygenase (ABM) superfamily enzyme
LFGTCSRGHGLGCGCFTIGAFKLGELLYTVSPGGGSRRSRIAVFTEIAIFPLITLVVILLGPVLERLSLVSGWRSPQAVTVPIMTWLVMLRVTRLLCGWLYLGGWIEPSK